MKNPTRSGASKPVARRKFGEKPVYLGSAAHQRDCQVRDEPDDARARLDAIAELLTRRYPLMLHLEHEAALKVLASGKPSRECARLTRKYAKEKR